MKTLKCKECLKLMILKKIEEEQRKLNWLKKKNRDPNFKNGKFLQYTLLFKN